jgi:2-keto-4-pentenoate hydratase/2-oxohepta-3-ene-1,7-dioic acid hydratase in catechol pathway
MGKSFDTFGPIGPFITTLDEIGDPNQLRIRFYNNGDLYHDYVTDDMEHKVPQLIQFASTI